MSNNPESEKLNRLLVVDDSKTMLSVYKVQLGDDYEITTAESGSAALALLKEADKPDLILLDIIMPNMDGYETCQHIKNDEETANIPMIFVTGKFGKDEEDKAFKLGCVDYITKPFDVLGLKARLAAHLSTFKTRIELQRDKEVLHLNIHDVQKGYDLLAYERSTVEAILGRMRHAPEFLPDHIRSLEEPLETATGDILLSSQRSNGTRHVLLGDFTGHGLPAALAGPMVSDLFYELTEAGYAPDEILKRINYKLYKKLPIEMYMTAIFVEFNWKLHTAFIWNAGMPPLFIFNHHHCIERVNPHNIPLGIREDINFDKPGVVYSIDKATRIVGYSDGIVETTNQADIMIGIDGLENAMSTVIKENRELEYILEVVKNHHGDQGEVSDDITLFEISFQDQKNPSANP